MRHRDSNIIEIFKRLIRSTKTLYLTPNKYFTVFPSHLIDFLIYHIYYISLCLLTHKLYIYIHIYIYRIRIFPQTIPREVTPVCMQVLDKLVQLISLIKLC